MIKNIKMVVERVHILLARLNYKLSDLLTELKLGFYERIYNINKPMHAHIILSSLWGVVMVMCHPSAKSFTKAVEGLGTI